MRMRIEQLTTPNFLVDLDKLEENIKDMAKMCREKGKKLCPMVKTHKSAAIAALQAEFGIEGFLIGTIDEAEMLIQQGFKELVLAYPIAGQENITRVLAMEEKAHIILSLDGLAAAEQLEAALAESGKVMDYLIIIDCGLHRFGIEPKQVSFLAQQLSAFKHLRFKGIATHPGQVYGKSDMAGVTEVAEAEVTALKTASRILTEAGIRVEVIATGSTPTAPLVGEDDTVTTLRPGNYVYYDAIQVALGVVPIEKCALTVLATVISQPQEDLLIMDAGSKCLGLDKGAHGVALLTGYGMVKGHPELIVESLSEEVGKIRVTGPTTATVGDKLEIIPNHACATANMTNYLVGYRQGKIEDVIAVDARGSSRDVSKMYSLLVG
ncbi:MAG: alanine racemase domain protein [Firmicutes bacterium]|nr:alanine racemase domain protein [Bacillota bacterium]